MSLPGSQPQVLPTQIAAAPSYGDPLARLHTITSAGIPMDRPVQAGDKIGLVAGDNVSRTLTYLNLTRNLLANAQAPGAENDPAYMVKSTVVILRRRYPRIALYQDLRSAQSNGAETTLVFDIKAVAAQASGRSNGAEIEIIALDRSMRPLSMITASGRNDGTSGDFVKAANAALGELSEKSVRLLR